MLNTSIAGAAARLIPDADRVLSLHDAELPQKDMLCGCFWTTIALRAAGIEVADQDEVAAAAGAVIAPRRPQDVAPGEAGRDDYTRPLPTIDDAEVAGTAVSGLVRAVAEVSAGACAGVPIAGPWSAPAVTAVLEAARKHGGVPIANVATGYFWGSHPTAADIAAYLGRGEDAEPAPDWAVGHFVGLLGVLEGDGGTLVVVGDTYRSLGWNALHVQPLERVAASLRGDAFSRGVLLVVDAGAEAAVRADLAAAHLTLELWDNGSPDAGTAA